MRHFMNAVTLPAKNYNMLILFRRSVPLKRFASVSAWAFYCKTALQAVLCLFEQTVPLKRFASVSAWAFYCKTALQAVLCLFQQNYLKSCPAVWNAVYVDLPEK